MNGKYMSGSELRQFLHISTRKMKFIMDNDLIPHENTGQITHKYLVKKTDAVHFKKKMDGDPNFMIKYKGCFSSRKDKFKEDYSEREDLILWILSHKAKYKAYIKSVWEDIPDAIPAQRAAKLIGINPKSLHRLHSEGKLNSVNVGHVQYCAKEEIIDYLASETQVRFNMTKEYLELFNGFLSENKAMSPINIFTKSCPTSHEFFKEI